MPFNVELWNVGRKIEDAIKPLLEEHFEAEFQRSDDIFDIIDFVDENKKICVEVKGRRVPADQYDDPIITCGKITEGFKLLDQGHKVYYFFVFTDKVLYHKLDEEDSFVMKVTGTNHLPHYLIPIKDLEEFNVELN